MVRLSLSRGSMTRMHYFMQRRFSSWIVDYANLPSTERLSVLHQTILPSIFDKNFDRDFLSLQRDFTRNRNSFKTSLKLRDDIKVVLKSKPEGSQEEFDKLQSQLKQLDQAVQKWLGITLTIDSLQLKRIQFETSSGSLLENVAHGESVHKVRTLRELKKRLHDGKRCFGLFHPKLEDEPLVFIHVGLTNELSGSLSSLDISKNETTPTHAMFYSVNSPIAALGGLDLASLLIKDVASYLKEAFPSIHTFSTLSPIPKFMSWLNETAKKRSPLSIPATHLAAIQQAVTIYYQKKSLPVPPGALDNPEETLLALTSILSESSYTWIQHTDLLDTLKEPMSWLGSYYLVKEKTIVKNQKFPLDDVARFHLRNGAILHRINWLGNVSRNGLQQSASLMVNYVYDLPSVPQNAKTFLIQPDQFPVGESVERILTV